MASLDVGDYRIYANFREQWPTVSAGNTYRTEAIGADFGIGKMSKHGSYAGVGISFFSDQAGAIDLNTDRVSLSLAYHFMLNHRGTAQLSAGLQGSFNFRSINPSLATFDSQYDPTTGTWDPNGARENFGRTKVMFGDAGLGAIYSQTVKKINYYLGFALDHVNQPKISFYPSGENVSGLGGDRLYIKETIHAGVSVPVADRLVLMPNALALVQGPSHEFDFGLNLKSILGRDPRTSTTAFHVGVQYRAVYDAVILNTRIDVSGFSCGLSYDINISKLLPASHTVGAPEIMLMYQGQSKKAPHPGRCPDMF
jgi:type IX secretion system PorP/SprF family membrane protein